MEGRSSIDILLSKNRDIFNRASMMADQKASIILGSEFIILSLIVTGIWRISQTEGGPLNTPIWSVVFFAFILLSVFFSLIVLLPSLTITKKKQTKSKNLLFFSSIAQMDLVEYQTEMKKLISNDEAIYEAIITDLYFEAKVLHVKKYKYLKLSYLSLILGVFLSMVTYCIEIFAS